MTTIIPRLEGPAAELLNVSRANLNALIDELNATRAGPPAPTTAEEVLEQLASLRVVLEAMVPGLDYHRASAIGSYLRPLSDLVYEREQATYPALGS